MMEGKDDINSRNMQHQEPVFITVYRAWWWMNQRKLQINVFPLNGFLSLKGSIKLDHPWTHGYDHGTKGEESGYSWSHLWIMFLKFSTARIGRDGMTDTFLFPVAPHFLPYLLTDCLSFWQNNTLPLTLLCCGNLGTKKTYRETYKLERKRTEWSEEKTEIAPIH